MILSFLKKIYFREGESACAYMSRGGDKGRGRGRISDTPLSAGLDLKALEITT